MPQKGFLASLFYVSVAIINFLKRYLGFAQFFGRGNREAAMEIRQQNMKKNYNFENVNQPSEWINLRLNNTCAREQCQHLISSSAQSV